MMDESGLVSIIMPSYNTGKYISDSIWSVKNQTYQNWELIVVDDCSDDNSLSIAHGFNDERIKIYKAKKNCGAAQCRNKGLREAKGRWIAFLDSDDIWHPDKLKRQITFMENKNIHFSYTKYEKIDENSRELGICVSGPRRIRRNRMYDYCWPGCLTVMYDSYAIPEKLKIKGIYKNNDYAMWLVLTKYMDCYLLNEVLAKYRIREGSISREKYSLLIKWHFLLFHKVEDMSAFKAYLFTGRNLFYGAVKKIIFEKSIRKAQ